MFITRPGLLPRRSGSFKTSKMTKIKGQNLRLSVGSQNAEKCIAAAQSCTLHLAAQVENTTSKDSDGAWDENTITSFSWDASVDAAVTDSVVSETTVSTVDFDPVRIDDDPFYVMQDPVTLRPQEAVQVDNTASYQVFLFKVTDGNFSPLGSASSGDQINYTNTSIESIQVVVAVIQRAPEASLTVTVIDPAASYDAIQDFMAAKTLLSVSFSVTTGSQNRYGIERIAYGSAYISDLSLTSQNHQVATFSCQLTGVGELHFSS